jgi:hypothetical protein
VILYSPFYLTYIVVDMLAIIIARAKADRQFKGATPHLVDNGLSIIQYADALCYF